MAAHYNDTSSGGAVIGWGVHVIRYGDREKF